ncbi:MarR family winged helix-turn-helix transcriptional regulator [Desulfovibrio sp. SGI.169]|uniref:MarR family winged helix-turn-helix transcriptional regulator n=1 Tax=Desulfovibrio sp. SGI.169 TaxID=3420561 RepID=UPI003CFC100C
MTYSAVFSNAARLREMGNAFILAELKKAGLRGLAPSHGDVLARLLACEACHMSELARQVRRSRSTLTALVEKLEKYGYVRRSADPEDSRGVLVALTAKGRSLRAVFEAVSRGLERVVAQKLSPEEAQTLDRLLAKCVEA